MKAKITKINQPRISRNNDVAFHRIHLQLEDGSHAMTDLVSSYRNFAWWKPVIQAGVGTWVDGAVLINPKKVDADSRVRIIQAPVIPQGVSPEPDQFSVRSQTNPEEQYKIVKTIFGWECSCPAFQYSKQPRTCKHLEGLKK